MNWQCVHHEACRMASRGRECGGATFLSTEDRHSDIAVTLCRHTSQLTPSIDPRFQPTNVPYIIKNRYLFLNISRDNCC